MRVHTYQSVQYLSLHPIYIYSTYISECTIPLSTSYIYIYTVHTYQSVQYLSLLPIYIYTVHTYVSQPPLYCIYLCNIIHRRSTFSIFTQSQIFDLRNSSTSFIDSINTHLLYLLFAVTSKHDDFTQLWLREQMTSRSWWRGDSRRFYK